MGKSFQYREKGLKKAGAKCACGRLEVDFRQGNTKTITHLENGVEIGIYIPYSCAFPRYRKALNIRTSLIHISSLFCFLCETCSTTKTDDNRRGSI